MPPFKPLLLVVRRLTRLPTSTSQGFERVYDFEPVNAPAILKVLAVENPATSVQSGADYKGVPDGKVVQAMEINRPQDVFDAEDDHIEPAE
jgi:hypothetical protein